MNNTAFDSEDLELWKKEQAKDKDTKLTDKIINEFIRATVLSNILILRSALMVISPTGIIAAYDRLLYPKASDPSDNLRQAKHRVLKITISDEFLHLVDDCGIEASFFSYENPRLLIAPIVINLYEFVYGERQDLKEKLPSMMIRDTNIPLLEAAQYLLYNLMPYDQLRASEYKYILQNVLDYNSPIQTPKKNRELYDSFLALSTPPSAADIDRKNVQSSFGKKSPISRQINYMAIREVCRIFYMVDRHSDEFMDAFYGYLGVAEDEYDLIVSDPKNLPEKNKVLMERLAPLQFPVSMFRSDSATLLPMSGSMCGHIESLIKNPGDQDLLEQLRFNVLYHPAREDLYLLVSIYKLYKEIEKTYI